MRQMTAGDDSGRAGRGVRSRGLRSMRQTAVQGAALETAAQHSNAAMSTNSTQHIAYGAQRAIYVLIIQTTNQTAV